MCTWCVVVRTNPQSVWHGGEGTPRYIYIGQVQDAIVTQLFKLHMLDISLFDTAA